MNVPIALVDQNSKNEVYSDLEVNSEFTISSERETVTTESTSETIEGEYKIESESDEIDIEENVEEVATEKGVVASGDNWRLDQDGTLEIFGGLVIGTSLNNGPSWITYKSQVIKMVFTEPTIIRSKVDVFDQYPNLVEIVGLEQCDISELTDLSYMFMDNPNLERLDLSNFDTSNVTNMRSMFSGCSSLTELDLSGFDTSKVTVMYTMFSGCTSLEKLDLSNASSQNLTSFGSGSIFGIKSSPNSAAPIIHLVLNANFKLTEAMQLRFWEENLHWFDQKNVKIPVTKDLISYHNNNNVTNIYRHGPSYFLNFETDGGSSIDTQELLADEKWTEPQIPIKEGYIFAGWYTDRTFNTRFDFEKGVTVSETTYAKWEEIVIETNELDIPVGTKQELIQFSESIKSVKIGDEVLSSDKYEVEVLQEVDTKLNGKKTVPLEIVLTNDEWNQIISIEASINIIWGSTLVTNSAGTGMPDLAVSSLTSEEAPYLMATQGTGLSNYGSLLSRPTMNVYRENLDNAVLNMHYQSVAVSPIELMKRWNEEFEKSSLSYGDVVEYTVFKYGIANSNYNGDNTWVSRNEELVRETIGYPKAYYELTRNEGYRLLYLNQLQLRNDVKVPLNITIDEINERAEEFFNIPDHIPNSDQFTFKVKNVDSTNTIGDSKKAIITVSEKLASGGNFSLDYEATFTVNPIVHEYFLDVDGNELKPSELVEFEFNSFYVPNPENYMTINGILYKYAGWKSSLQGEINTGKPPLTTQEETYIYLYDQANRLIHVSLPTNMVFGTYNQTEDIESKSYILVNHSQTIGTEIILESFKEHESDIQFLEKLEADPSDEKKAARLDLLVNDEVKIDSLNKKTINTSISKLAPEDSATIDFSGRYFGDFSQSYKANYTLKLLFKPVEGE